MFSAIFKIIMVVFGLFSQKFGLFLEGIARGFDSKAKSIIRSRFGGQSWAITHFHNVLERRKNRIGKY